MYHPSFGLIRMITVDGQVWFDVRTIRRALGLPEDFGSPEILENVIVVESLSDGSALCVDSAGLRAMVEASPYPGLAFGMLEWAVCRYRQKGVTKHDTPFRNES